jgi:glycosyltransferase involved in cell wall biosynthesis
MKVCYIGFARYPGVGAIAMYEHSRNLAKLGADVHVVATAEKGKRGEELEGVTVFLVESPSVKKLSVYPLLFIKKAYAYLKTFPDGAFDIIHVVHFSGSSFFPVFLRKKAKKWVFFTGSGPIQGGLISKVGWWIQSAESRFFDHLILRDKSHIPPFSYRKDGDITIVPIGADFNLFSPGKSDIREKYGIDPDEFLFLYVGTLHPIRRVETVLEAFNLMSENPEARLMVVGNSGTQRLRTYAETLTVEDRVVFTGTIPHREVPQYMRCCDVFVSHVPMTPDFDIQPPLKTVEALACGLPVIATNTLGNRRFISHKKNGYLTGDDAVSLKDAMVTLMEDEPLRRKLEKNAHSSVSMYNWETIVRDTLYPVYERLITD